MNARCAALSLTVALASACSAARTAVPTRVASHPLPDAASSVPPTEVDALPDLTGSLWTAAVDANGARDVVLAGLRARVTDEQIEWGRDRFADPILVATPVGSRWVFVSTMGDVAASDGFLGALHPLGAMTAPSPATQDSRGRVVLVDAHGAVWSTDGTAPIARLSGAPHARVIVAVFVDAAHGALVVDGGALYRTDDGGTTFVPVALGDDAAWNVERVDTRLVVSTTAGPRELTATGALVPTATPPDTETARDVPDGVFARVSDALTERWPALLATRENAATVGDTVYTVNDRDLLAYDRVSGRLQRTVRDAVPEGCQLAAWGNALAATCFGIGTPALSRWDDVRAFVPVRGMEARDPNAIALSTDGHHAIALGPCTGDPVPTDPDAWACVLRDDGVTWHSQQLPAAVTTLRPMHGDVAILQFADTSAASTPPFALLHTDTAALETVRLDARAQRDGVHLERLAFAPDGTLVGLAHAARNPALLLVHGAAQPLTTRALPNGAAHVAFVDRDHGFAAAFDTDALWRTTDGGASWTAVPLPFTVTPTAFDTPAEPGAVSACSESECIVARSLVVRGWGPLSAPTETIVGAANVAQGHCGMVGDSGGLEPVSLACTPHGHASVHRALAAPPHTPPARTVSLASVGVRARIDVWPDAFDEPRAHLNWRGADTDGAFAGATRVAPFRVRNAAADSGTDPSAAYILRGAGRSAALFERCDGVYDESCELFWATNGGALVTVDARHDAVHGVRDGVVADTLFTRDGGALVLVSNPLAENVDVVLSLAPDGSVRGRRGFAWDRAWPQRGLARDATHEGLLVGDARDPSRFTFYPLTPDPHAPAVELAPFALADIALCHAPRPADALELHATERGFNVAAELVDTDVDLDVRATFEIAHHAVCLRALDDWIGSNALGDRSRWRGVGLHLGVNAHGAVTSRTDDGRTAQPLSCSLP